MWHGLNMKIRVLFMHFKTIFTKRLNKQMIPIIFSALVGFVNLSFFKVFWRVGKSSVSILFPHFSTHK